MLGPDGTRLAKRHRAATLEERAEPPEATLALLAHTLGLATTSCAHGRLLERLGLAARETGLVQLRPRNRDSVPDVPLLPVVAAVVALALAAGLLEASFSGGPAGPPALDVSITVTGKPYGRPIPAGFLGLSLEYSALEPYAGRDPGALDPVFEQLIRNLTPAQHPMLRIGGDSADWTWWPVAGMARPPGVTFTLDSTWTSVARALATKLGARLLLGLNLEADSAELTATEQRELSSRVGAGPITAFELGNEPSLYGTFAWYRTAGGRGVPGRPRSYGFDAFLADFTRIAAALPGVRLAGPTTGGLGWMRDLNRFLDAAPAVHVLTVHRYPLQLCDTGRRSRRFPTLGHLLSPGASTGLADDFTTAVAVGRARGLPVRIDELNTVSCGAAPAVSQTFATALWALDTLFELARVGVDGVNVHTFPGAGYALFAIGHGARGWSASVAPEYYGLLAFARMAPPGSRLLELSGSTGGKLKAWATLAAGGTVRVALINEDAVRARVVHLGVAQDTDSATLTRLSATTLRSRTGVTLAGQSFGAATTTGDLAGARQTSVLHPVDHRYVIEVPPASAALLSAGPARAR